LEWFLAQRGRTVRGYARAVFSGLTTRALAGVLLQLLEQGPLPTGLYHVASEPITKFDMLSRINEALGVDVRIERDDDFVCDRSLDGRKFTRQTGLQIPSWNAMIDGLKAEAREYERGGLLNRGWAS
jgi:dTDP-4-dehydrorhamnose reductase